MVLLPETFYKKGDRGTAEDWEVEGIPVLEGERFRLTTAPATATGCRTPGSATASSRWRRTGPATSTRRVPAAAAGAGP